jgi:hypothetical protein
MTNAFSPGYKPKIDTGDMLRESKISATRTRQRKEAMKSADDAVAKQARGTLPGAPLSKRGRKV